MRRPKPFEDVGYARGNRDVTPKACASGSLRALALCERFVLLLTLSYVWVDISTLR